MTRVIPVAERNVFLDPPRVITVPATTATLALADEVEVPGEISQRFIQNTGANPLFYSEGVSTATGGPSCDNLLNYHGYLAAGQQVDCSAHRQIVSVYSVLGTTIAVSIRRRKSMSHHN